ncbi:MerR family transcriptional regulator [Chitinibacter sp. FCG-7]|uniref:MerR family transcriptional regulator n=1 Tax=Chitinibacter mangrovi TaxID=3153927 RepID=A0AAU7FBX1_9NEIS
MKIGELAHIAQCSVETIRFYEKELYWLRQREPLAISVPITPNMSERLRFIRNCRALDMSHEEIHTLLRLADQAR